MPTNDRIRKITILQLPSEVIQARIVNGYTHSAKLSPNRLQANCKAKDTESRGETWHHHLRSVFKLSITKSGTACWDPMV